MGSVPAPKRGQIWLVNLDPTIGSEIKKKRPCAVIGEQLFMRPRMTIVVPITGWKSKYDECVWMVKVDKNQRSGLSKTSVADAKDWFSRYYGAANATLVIAGDVSVDEARILVEKYFSAPFQGYLSPYQLY